MKSLQVERERCGEAGPPRRWEKKMAPRIHMMEFVWRLMLPSLL